MVPPQLPSIMKSKSLQRETDQGKITIRPFCAPDIIEPLSFEKMKQEYEEGRPILYDKESLISAASNAGTNVCVALQNKGILLAAGYWKSLVPGSAGWMWGRGS